MQNKIKGQIKLNIFSLTYFKVRCLKIKAILTRARIVLFMDPIKQFTAFFNRVNSMKMILKQ